MFKLLQWMHFLGEISLKTKKPQWAGVVVYLYMPMEHSCEFCFGLHFGPASKPKYTHTESSPCSKNSAQPKKKPNAIGKNVVAECNKKRPQISLYIEISPQIHVLPKSILSRIAPFSEIKFPFTCFFTSSRVMSRARKYRQNCPSLIFFVGSKAMSWAHRSHFSNSRVISLGRFQLTLYSIPFLNF